MNITHTWIEGLCSCLYSWKYFPFLDMSGYTLLHNTGRERYPPCAWFVCTWVTAQRRAQCRGAGGARVDSRACLVLHESQWHGIIGFLNDSFYLFICDRFVTGSIVFIGVSSPAWVWAHLYCGARTERAGREVRAAVRWDSVRGITLSQEAGGK